MKKKKVLFHSNFCDTKTGFGRNAKEVLSYLYKTGKYDIVEYAAGGVVRWSTPELKKTPWKSFGAWPDDDNELSHLHNHKDKDSILRMVSYGSHNIDKIILQEKPDIYIGVEDIWAFNGYWDKKWWNKITSVIHTTLDSLPILPQAIDAAKKVKHYYVWAKFAQEALNNLGFDQVKTLHGAINTKKFYKLSENRKNEIRRNNNLQKDDFIVGFVFRNQLRKSVPNLLRGFKLFKDQNPEIKAKLILHTNWEEKDHGWDIPRLLTEPDINISPSDVLTTYVCRNCREYEVKPFCGNDADCKFCNQKANPNPQSPQERTGQTTTGVNFGISEDQLNEVYNLMNVYVHPFTSGGQEIPIQEAKLAELITLVTNYSCGTEYCSIESGGFPLEWAEYREHGTQFIKASTYPSSIAKQLKKVAYLPSDKISELGRKARNYVIENCGTETVGKAYEKIIDECPYTEWDFNFEEPKRNPSYQNKNIEDNKAWLKDIYKNILMMDVTDEDEGLLYWMNCLKSGMERQNIYNYFIGEARRINSIHYPPKADDLFDNNGNKKVLFVMPQSLGDCYLSTALFQSIKELYPDHDLYIGTNPQYFSIFDGNPFVYKCIPYFNQMENEHFMTGQGTHKGFVDVVFNPHFGTQQKYDYISKNKFAFDLK